VEFTLQVCTGVLRREHEACLYFLNLARVNAACQALSGVVDCDTKLAHTAALLYLF